MALKENPQSTPTESPMSFLYKDATEKLATAEVCVERLTEHLRALEQRPGVPDSVLTDARTQLADAKALVIKHETQRQYFRGRLFGERHPKIQAVKP